MSRILGDMTKEQFKLPDDKVYIELSQKETVALYKLLETAKPVTAHDAVTLCNLVGQLRLEIFHHE